MRVIIRNVIVGGALAALPLTLVAAPAGAQSHPVYVKTLHHLIPKTERVPNTLLVKLGEAVCSDLRSGNTVLQESESFLNEKGNPFTAYQDGEIIGVSVAALCPSYLPEVRRFEQSVTSS